MKIIICEDNLNHQEETRKILNKLFFHEEDVIIQCFDDGEELIEALINDEEFYADLVFMDIKMPRLDGIQTAKVLRKKNRDTAIIFLTAHSEFVFLGYEVHAYDYILKPITESKLKKVVQRFLDDKKYQVKDYLVVNKKGGRKRVSLNRVKYFVSDKRKITAILEEPYAPLEFYMTMKDLEERLSGLRFLRCHQSFLVNLDKITDWNRNHIISEGGIQIPISKKYRLLVDHAMIGRHDFSGPEK